MALNFRTVSSCNSCHYSYRCTYGLLALLLVASFHLHGQSDSTSHLSASLSELITLPIDYTQDLQFSSSSFKSASTRESPGIVTVITREEILASGAREMVDLLRMVPGFEVGKSDDNVLSIGVRGLWSDDGKLLFMLDGIMLNDPSYGAVPLGQRIPIDNIERIEIVRGPGAAMYGGFASLAVVRIFTQNAEIESQSHANVRMGIEAGGRSRTSAQITASHKSRNGAHFSLSAYTNEGILSSQEMEMPNGEYYAFQDSSDVSSHQIHAIWEHKGLSVSFMSERVSHLVAPNNFSWLTKGNYFRVSKQFKINDRLNITPSFFWKQQHPWNYFNDNSGTDLEYNLIDRRVSGDVIANYQVNDRLFITTGVNYYGDKSRYEYDWAFTTTGEQTASFHDLAAFSEIGYQSAIGNFTIGGRAEKHSAIPAAVVPRVAYTKAWERFHIKALYSYAFRTPGIQNINLTAGEEPIKAEIAKVLEGEIGYRIPSKLSATINAYRIEITDPIVYLADEANGEYTYINRGRTGSLGVDGVLKILGQWGNIQLQYSQYAAHNNSIEEFEKADNSKELLGMPRNKFTARSVFNLPAQIKLGTNILWSGERTTYLPFDEDYEDLREVTYAPYWLLGLNLQRSFVWNGQVDISLGMHNVLDKLIYFIAPSNSGVLPLPDHRREIYLSIRYTLF